mgnify:CR=1 FL=1|jgi:hypothetical protein
MNSKDTENPRERVYCVVDKERFEKIKKGAYGFLKLVALAFLFAIFANLISSCRKTEPKIYEVKTSGVMYQTSEGNKRLKEPKMREESVFFIVEGEQ